MAIQRRVCGKFTGHRVNCEEVPRLPSRLARRVFRDPSKNTWAALWHNGSGEVVEYLLMTALPGGPAPGQAGEEWLAIERPASRPDSVRALRLLSRPVPKGAMEGLFLCIQCQRPCRHLYLWRNWGNLGGEVGI